MNPLATNDQRSRRSLYVVVVGTYKVTNQPLPETPQQLSLLHAPLLETIVRSPINAS